MTNFFAELNTRGGLTDSSLFLLTSRGFVVLPDVISSQRVARLAIAYDKVEESAVEPDKRIGSTCTRVNDFVNRGPEFGDIYLNESLLQACCHVIGRPFKLSSFHSRSVHSQAPAQDLHVDVKPDSADRPLLGFILMVDEFRQDNGATRFLPGNSDEASACGTAGSLLMYDGSTLHGHGANKTGKRRRSLQGAFIPRTGRSATDFPARMGRDTYDELSPLAKWLLSP